MKFSLWFFCTGGVFIAPHMNSIAAITLGAACVVIGFIALAKGD